ncbi:hypothetical protein ACFVFQ_33960 [Streptomyces sp. NPDC057743]|uniref:hypothetical protein n=1 Tax=Streptomyces sp. NPDC057743 TaxID=3346236 RepID=UPI0036924574
MTRRTMTVASASAAVCCLGALLTGCGSAAGSGYAAVGAAGPSDGAAPTRAAHPPGRVQLTPLDGDSGGNDATAHPRPPTGPGGDAPSPGATSAAPPPSPADPPAAPPASPTPGQDSNSAPPPTGSPGPPPTSPSPTPPSPTIPAGPDAPAGLVVGKPALADTDVRWCQRITIDFLNTGPQPVTTGTVAFGSHVIGPLGVDWATLHSTRPLPLPLTPGKPKTATWRVCVDAWRVPLGMHLDTKEVTFKWK